jgi:hypothetical protein
MRRVMTICMLAAAFTGLALAESWSGRLVDSTCYDQQKNVAACDPTSATTTFALSVSNKIYKLDDAGNTKAMEAIKNRADRSTDPNKPPVTEVNAKVTGTKGTDEILKVEAIEVK